MTASARFSMASRLMRDATNLAGSQGCSARLRKQDTGHTGTQYSATSSRSTLFAHRSDPSFFVSCIYSCLPTCVRILRYRPGPPSETSTLSCTAGSCTHATSAPQADFLIAGRPQNSTQCRQ